MLAIKVLLPILFLFVGETNSCSGNSKIKICNIPNFSAGVIVSGYQDEKLVISIPDPVSILKRSMKNIKLGPQLNTVEVNTEINKLAEFYHKALQEKLDLFSEEVFVDVEEKSKRETARTEEDDDDSEEDDQESSGMMVLNREKRNPLTAIFSWIFRRISIKSFKSAFKWGGRTLRKNVGNIAVFGAFEAVSIALHQHSMYKFQGDIEGQINLLKSSDTEMMKTLSKVTVINAMAIDSIHDFELKFKDAIVNAVNRESLLLVMSNFLQELVSDLTFSLSRLFEGHLNRYLMSLDAQKKWLDSRYPDRQLFDQITPNFKLSVAAIDSDKFNIYVTVKIPVINSKTLVTSMGVWKPKILINDECYTSKEPNLILSVNLNHRQLGITNYTVLDLNSCSVKGTIICPAEAVLELSKILRKNPLCSLSTRSKRSLLGESNALKEREELLASNLATLLNKNAAPMVPEVSFNSPTQSVIAEITRLKQIIESNNKKISDIQAHANNNSYLVPTVLVLIFLLVVSSIGYLIKKHIELKNRRRRLADCSMVKMTDQLSRV
ncbi:MAG: hypothetical protein SISXV1_gp3 [Sanya Ischnura senegalensis xinmovirus 1]|uniref:Uncharacterized protein n=1 Tax=Sanya Ischnura senegalensis xinmovirus 1 TaxID=2905558 RepID=A0A8K1XGN2_9MONO|nr:MAG: hypothetical protein SISXV1_gp3 [Sanya Ischnura senegalensis xinmovirus 1]